MVTTIILIWEIVARIKDYRFRPFKGALTDLIPVAILTYILMDIILFALVILPITNGLEK